MLIKNTYVETLDEEYWEESEWEKNLLKSFKREITLKYILMFGFLPSIHLDI